MKLKLRNLIFTGLLVSIGVILSQFLSLYYPPSTSIIKFGIGYVPLIIISILFGPEIGIFAGFTQDIIGFFLMGSAHGPYYFGFTFSAMLYGYLPGILIRIKTKVESKNIFFMNIFFISLFFLVSIWYLFNIDVISSSNVFNSSYRYVFITIGLVSSVGLLLIAFFNQKKNKVNNDFQLIFFIVFVLYILVSVVLTPIWLWDMYEIPIWPQIPLRILKMPLEVFVYTIIIDSLLKVLKVQMNKEE
ncbi:MAG: folate family ECF transporter S component [Candidatus Izemoplasmatales bacterium]|nr:folate family ECF transporter S component [Candidatus Izemoplasmatales bacterium]